ncbi:MAG: hypothetical protein ACPHEP_01440 [Acidimicrobiales bacterium]
MLCSIIWGQSKTDQERCQAEADYMAKHKLYQHVGKTIGRFEGVGYGRSPSPPTCVPDKSKGYRVTGDATAKTSDGITVRVRSWR